MQEEFYGLICFNVVYYSVIFLSSDINELVYCVLWANRRYDKLENKFPSHKKYRMDLLCCVEYLSKEHIDLESHLTAKEHQAVTAVTIQLSISIDTERDISSSFISVTNYARGREFIQFRRLMVSGDGLRKLK